MDSLHCACNHVADTSLIWTIIVSVCGVVVTILMLIVTYKYFKITKNIFLVSQRPYIGRTSFKMEFKEETHSIYLRFFVKNFGNVPARKVDTIFQLYINDRIIPVENSQSKNQIFYPQENLPIDIALPDNPLYFNGIKHGDSRLKIVTEIKYYGVTDKQYSTTETEIYNHTVGVFVKQDGDWT